MLGIPLTATALKASLIGNAVLVLLVLGNFAFQQVRVSAAQADTATAKTELANERAAIAQERARFEAAARAAETAHTNRLNALAKQAQQEKEDADARIDRTVDEYRRGERRLRSEWAAEVATLQLSHAVAAEARTDAAADRRAGAIERVLRIGAKYDTRIRELQGVILSMQEAGRLGEPR